MSNPPSNSMLGGIDSRAKPRPHFFPGKRLSSARFPRLDPALDLRLPCRRKLEVISALGIEQDSKRLLLIRRKRPYLLDQFLNATHADIVPATSARWCPTSTAIARCVLRPVDGY